jgi:hypothetical protein
MIIDLQREAQVAEVLAVLEDVTVITSRVLDAPETLQFPVDLTTNLQALHDQAQRFSCDTYTPPIAEAVQKAQDLREAVGCHGFRVDHPIIATAWADLVTALSEVFDEPCFPV